MGQLLSHYHRIFGSGQHSRDGSPLSFSLIEIKVIGLQEEKPHGAAGRIYDIGRPAMILEAYGC